MPPVNETMGNGFFKPPKLPNYVCRSIAHLLHMEKHTVRRMYKDFMKDCNGVITRHSLRKQFRDCLPKKFRDRVEGNLASLVLRMQDYCINSANPKEQAQWPEQIRFHGYLLINRFIKVADEMQMLDMMFFVFRFGKGRAHPKIKHYVRHRDNPFHQPLFDEDTANILEQREQDLLRLRSQIRRTKRARTDEGDTSGDENSDDSGDHFDDSDADPTEHGQYKSGKAQKLLQNAKKNGLSFVEFCTSLTSLMMMLGVRHDQHHFQVYHAMRPEQIDQLCSVAQKVTIDLFKRAGLDITEFMDNPDHLKDAIPYDRMSKEHRGRIQKPSWEARRREKNLRIPRDLFLKVAREMNLFQFVMGQVAHVHEMHQ